MARTADGQNVFCAHSRLGDAGADCSSRILPEFGQRPLHHARCRLVRSAIQGVKTNLAPGRIEQHCLDYSVARIKAQQIASHGYTSPRLPPRVALVWINVIKARTTAPGLACW